MAQNASNKVLGPPSRRLEIEAKFAIADDRVLRVGVDVEDRRVIEGNPHRFELGGQRPGKPLGERDVAAPAQRRHRRPFGERRLQAGNAAAFLIDADPRGQVGHEVGRVEGELRHLLGLDDVAGKQDDAAQTEVPRQRLELDGKRRAVEAGDQQLADLTPQRGHRSVKL